MDGKDVSEREVLENPLERRRYVKGGDYRGLTTYKVPGDEKAEELRKDWTELRIRW